ncbi:thioredoxin-dependent thiol peroxidase [Chitinophaga caeni]|uniref:thioredoxin-dependent peroxiredoxin n=2 Tax=Chitinophaga caeni TaxID=2029983 RepID=A0A291R0A5_9BACT|nr:thioredoxin-dependent thiol peroxidase [Chitinophaga caeni]
MHLKEGDKAPVFKGKDQDGNTVSLSDFKGKKVILYFYPKDDTPGCTAQACNLRDHYPQLTKKGYVVIGVSIDDEKKHQKFINKYDLPFTLLADDDHKIVNQYGVFGEKKFMGRTFEGTHRTTFLIDEKGKIAKIITKPKTKSHTEEILEFWEGQ